MFDALGGFDPIHLGLLIAIALCSAVVRGYAGFGMSAIIITTASVFMSPRELIPVMYALELSATIVMLPKIWRDVDPKFVLALVVGAIVMLPIGQQLLLQQSGSGVRAIVGVVVGIGALGTLSGFRRAIAHGPLYGVGVGMVFGLVSGVSAVGGLIASLIIVATSAEYERSRASMIMLFAFGPMFALPLAFYNGVATDTTLPLYLMLAPSMVIGVWIGGRIYAGSKLEVVRRRIMWVILALALMVIARVATGF